MNGTPGGTITVGTRLFFDGGLWEVTELTATAVVMRDALGGLRQASISGLLADPATRLLDATPAEPAPAGPGTSGLTPPETEEMRRLAGHPAHTRAPGCNAAGRRAVGVRWGA
jgi:hypothetical protein